MKGRWKSTTPVTNYSVTQKIRTALIDAGHTDLAAEQISESVRILEENYADALERLEKVEDSKVTESGVHRIVTSMYADTLFSWSKIFLISVIGALATGLVGVLGWVAHLAWKGWHTT